MATVADLKEETPEKKIQAEKEVTDGEFQHPNVTSSDDISEKIDAAVTDSNIITKDTVAEETLHADHVKLPGEPKGEILCKTPELVQDSSEEAGQKETDLQETKIEMPKEKQACTLKDGVDKTYGLPVEAGQKDTSADVPVKIIIESNHDIILASQDIEHVKIAASSISSRDCQETEAVTTVESIKEEVQRSNVIEEILPGEDNRLKNGSIIDSELEKEGNVSDSMVNLKTMVTTEQREYKFVVEEESIVKTDDPSAIQHIEISQDDANKKDERDAYAVETVDEVRKNQIAIPSTPETKGNQVATPSEIIEIKVPQNSEIASNFQASIEDDQQKDQYVNDINDTAVETGASGEQMLDESYATKDVKVKADAECSNMKESASADKSGSTEAVSDEHFETSITTISIEKDLTDRGTSYSEDTFPKAVESNQGKTAAEDELKSKEDFDILLVSESAAGEKFQVERTQDLAEVASMKEKEKPEAVAEVSYIVIDEKEKTDEALPSTESTEEKTCQLNETSTLKNVDESSSSEPSVSSNIKKDEKEDDIHKEELVEDRNIHANLYRDDHEDEKLDRTLDTCETVGDDAGAMHPENTHGEIKNDQFKAVKSETNDTNKDKAKAEEAEAAYTESENAPSQEVSSSGINDHHEAMIQDNNIRIPGEDQIFSSHKLDEEIVDVKDSQDQEISREDCEKEYQNLNRKITESQHADDELVTQDSADKICNNSQETQLENLDKVPDTRSKIQSHEKTCISSVEDGENTFIPSVSGILKNDMQSNIVEEIVILRNERESLNQETLAGERDTYSLPREDENEKGQTGASFYETFVEKENNSSEACEEEGTMKNTEDSVHGNQDIREKDLIEEEATYARSDELEDEINAGPSCTSKPFTETIDPENEVKAIHASNEKATYASGDKLEDDIDASPSCTSKPLTETIDPEKEVEAIHASSEFFLDKTVATVVLTSKLLDGTLEEEKEVETMHAGSEQLPDASVASSIINEESQKEIVEGDKDHLVHSDQSSKTDKVMEEIEDDRHFNDDQISVTENLVKEVHSTNVDGEIQEADIKSPCIDESSEELSNNTQEVVHSSDLKLLVKEVHSSEHLVKEVHPTNVEDESQEADIRSPGIEESTEELSNNTQEVVHSSDLKLASETTNSDQSSKDIAPIEAEDEEHTFALQSESTAPSSDFSREQTYQSNKAPVDMMLNKQCHATTTLDSDIETKDQTESLTCEVETSSFEKKDDHEEREIDIQLKGTCDDVQNVAGGPCAEEIHIKNTKEIILDGDTGLESVKQVDVKCTHGDQDMVKDDLKEVEESDRGSIEKSMYEEAFMEDNAFHFSPEKHEEDQFTSAHKAQDEARKKELADYSSKQENNVDEKVHDKEGVESENDPNSRTSTDNEEASRSITYGEKEGDTEKQIESLNPKPGDLPVVQTLFMKSLDFDDQKNDEGVEDPKTSRVEEVLNIGDHSTVEDPKEDLENKNVLEILHERDENESVQTSLDFLVEKEGKNLLGVKVPIKGDMEQPTSMESREPAERVGTGTITKEFTEFFAVEGMSEIKGRCPQAMENDSLNEIDTTKMEGLKVQEFGIAREHSRIESEKVELRKENGNNGNGVGNDDNSKMQEEPEEGKPTDEKIDKKVDEKMQNQTERDAQSAGMLHADIVEEYSVIDNLNSSEQNVNSVDSVKCKEETKDVEGQHNNMVAVPAFLLSATKETFEEKEKPEAAFCAATPSTEGEIIEKEKREAEVATTELFNTIPTTNNGMSNEKGQRMNVFEGEEKKNSDDSTIAKDMIFEEGGCDLKKSLFMDRNETDNDKGDMVEIKMTHEQDLAPLVTAQSNSEVLDCNKLNTAEEKDEGTSKNLSSLSTTEPNEGTICKDRGQEVPEDTSLVHNDKADPSKFMKEDESTVLMASQPIVTEGLLPAEEKVPTPKEEDACTVDNYLPVSQFLLNLIHEEFPDDENTKADNLKQEGIVPKDYIKTETRTEEDNRDSMELPANNSSLMLEEKKHDFCERPENRNAEGMEELQKLSNSPNEREIDKDTNDDNFFLSESAESRHGDLKILNDEAKEELTIVSESGIEEDVSSTHPSYDEKVYEQKTPEEHAIESCLDKNIDVKEVDSKDEEILKQESNDSEDKIESQLDNEMINEAGPENKTSVVIQPEEIKELEDSINNKGTLPNTQGVEQTKASHSEIYVDDLQLRSTDNVEKIKEEVAEDQTTKMETLSPDEKEPYKNLDAVEQKNPSENIIIFVDPKEVQYNVETVDKAMEDEKAFSAIKSAEVKCAESLVAREIEEVLPEVKTLPVTELAEATDPECIPTGKIVERDTDKKSTSTMDEECLTTSEIVEKVKEEDETSTTIKSGVKDAEHFNGSEETAQSNQFQVAEVLGYIVVQGQKQGEIFENESEFVKETEKEEKAQMNINIKESSSGDLKESYLSMENQTDMQKRAAEDKNKNAESYLERKEIKDSTVKEEKIEEAKKESSGQNVTEESDHETAPLIEMKEGKHSPPNKKHGNILSGVRSKVKHSISSVKKAITCSSSVSHLIHEGN